MVGAFGRPSPPQAGHAAITRGADAACAERTPGHLRCEPLLRSVKKIFLDSGAETRFAHKCEVLPDERKTY